MSGDSVPKVENIENITYGCCLFSSREIFSPIKIKGFE